MTPEFWLGHIDAETTAQALADGNPLELPDAGGWTPLHLACLRGSRESTDVFLAAGLKHNAKTEDITSNVKAQVVRPAAATFYLDQVHRWLPVGSAFDKGMQPLHIAAQQGHEDVVDALLDASARATTASATGGTPLHYAAVSGAPGLVQRLLTAPGTKVDAATKNRKSVVFYDAGVTPLHAACEAGSAGAVDALFNAGADPLARSKYGCGAVFFAARGGNVGTLNRLVELGCDATEAPEYLNFPLVEAVRGRHVQFVHRLLELGAPHVDGRNQAPMLLALEMDDDRMIDALLAGGVPDIECDSLDKAVMFSSTRQVKVLLASGANPDAIDESRTVLHHAASHGQLRIVEALIDAKADLNVVSDRGTPLILAVANAQWEVARCLINAGADVNLQDNHGNTPLWFSYNDEATSRLLIEHGADPDATNKHGKSVRMLLADSGATPSWLPRR